jgi:hypothetical protein
MAYFEFKIAFFFLSLHHILMGLYLPTLIPPLTRKCQTFGRDTQWVKELNKEK